MQHDLRLAGGLLVLVAGCGAPSAPARAPGAAPTGSALPQLPPPGPITTEPTAPTAAFPDADDPGLTPIDRGHHTAARTAAREGRWHDAKRLLGRLAAAYGAHPVLVAQYNAVGQHMEEEQAGAKEALNRARLVVVAARPAGAVVGRAAPAADPRVPKLVKRSDKVNQVTDEEEWFARNAITLPEYRVPFPSDLLFGPGVLETTTVIDQLRGFAYQEVTPEARYLPTPLPVTVPLTYGTLKLTKVIDSPPYMLAVYDSRVLAAFEPGPGGVMKVAGLFDFGAWSRAAASTDRTVKIGEAKLTTAAGTTTGDITVTAPTNTMDLTFALAREGVLYVAHANLHYAKENKGQNAYVGALDLATGDFLWQSAPLVCNAHAFSIVHGGVVCGYGYTSEPDFVTVLDRTTGKTASKIPVPTGPEYVIVKDEHVHVRTYDRDLVYDIAVPRGVK